jgi:hypothetical protein
VSISVQWQKDDKSPWNTIHGYSSIDAAKASCREHRKDWSDYNAERNYRILSNDTVQLVSRKNCGLRLTWEKPVDT